MKTEGKTTQLSGLTDFELELDRLADKIKETKSSLECIGILRFAMHEYHNDKLKEELIRFFAWQNTLPIKETERVVGNYLKERQKLKQQKK